MITATKTDSPGPPAHFNLRYVWLICGVAAMGGLLFGWDWVVIGGAKPFFQRYFQLTSEAQIGWANSCALIGCLVGALVAGALSDKFGRKRLLILAALEADKSKAHVWRQQALVILESLWTSYSSRGTSEPSILIQRSRKR